MGAQSAGHDLFAIWLSIIDVSVEEIFKEFPRTRVLTNFIKENFDRNYNSYIEFSDVLSSAESDFQEGKAESWGALRNSVPFRRGINIGLFLENPW